MRARAVGGIDYTGPTGGLIGAAVVLTAITLTAFYIGVARALYSIFIKPRIKALEGLLADERESCRIALDRANTRIASLEGALMMHGPQELAQAVQRAVSELHVEVRDVKEGK